MRVTIAKADVPNANNHLYTTETLQAVIDKVNKSNHPLFGQVGMPTGTSIDMNKATHTVSDLKIVDGELVGTVTFLDTVDGNILRSAMEANASLDFRLMGVGNRVEKDGYFEITNYQLIAINAVTDGA